MSRRARIVVCCLLAAFVWFGYWATVGVLTHEWTPLVCAVVTIPMAALLVGALHLAGRWIDGAE